MSDAGLDADLNLSIDAALAEINRLQAELQAATDDLVVTITADTSQLPGELQSAIDGADTTAQVEADTADVTTATEAAVDNADATVDVEADTAEVAPAVTAAVDNADAVAVVGGDAGDVTSAVAEAIDSSNTTVRVTGDAGDVTSAVQGAIDASNTTVRVRGEAGDVTSAVEGAIEGSNTTVRVRGDAGDVTAAVEGAIAASNTTVRITGDAGDVTDAVNAALQNASTTINIGGLDQVRRQISDVGRTSQQTTQGIQVGWREVRRAVGAVLLGSFVRVGAEFNTLQQTSRAALTAVLDGAGAATQQMEELTRFTACVDEDTQALTKNGWRSRKDLQVGDRILTLNPETCLSEWQPIEEIFSYQGTHRMLAMTGENHDSLTTLNHAWPVRSGAKGRVLFTQSRTLDGDDRLIVVAPHADAPTETPLGAEIEVATLRRREVTHTGIVWCPSVGNRTWFAQRGGHRYFTGNSSPFPLDEFIRAQQTMIGFGFAAEDVVPTLSAIQDAVAATGQSADQIGEITTILAQVNSTGKFTADVFNQLGFRGVDAAQLIANEMGITAAEVRDSVTAGTLDAQEALTALTTGMQAEFEGAADGVKETFAGATDRVRAALRDISSALLETFIDPQGGGAAVDFANNLADALRRLEDVVRGGFSDALGNVGAAALDSLLAALEALEPLIIAGTQAFIAAAPALEVLAGLLSVLPPELLTMVAAWRLLSRVTGVGSAAFTLAATRFAGLANSGGAVTRTLAGSQGAMARTSAAAGGLATSMGRAAGGFIAANGPMLALTAGLGIMSIGMQQSAERAREQAQRVQSLARSMGEADTAAEGFVTGFQDLIADGDRVATSLAEAGISADEFARAMTAGGNTGQIAFGLLRANADANIVSLINMVKAANDAAESQTALAISSGEISEELGQQIIASDNSFAAWTRYSEALAKATARGEAQRDAVVDQQFALGNLTSEQADAIRGAEDLATAQELLTEALSESGSASEFAVELLDRYQGATGFTADANRDFAVALRDVDIALGLFNGTLGLVGGNTDLLSEGLGSGVGAAVEMTTASDLLAERLTGTNAVMDAFNRGLFSAAIAYENVIGSTAELADTFTGTDAAATASQRALLQLALAAETGAISSEDLEAAIADLPFTLDDFESFAAAAAGAVLDFASAVESSMPTISDNLGELDKITFSGIGDALEDTLSDLEDFNANLEALSPFPALQQMAAEEGPETAAALAGAVRDGKDAMLLEYEGTARDITGEQNAITQQAIERWGPEYAIAMGLVGESASTNLGLNFDAPGVLNGKMDEAGKVMISKSGAISESAKVAGNAGTQGFNAGVLPMRDRALSAVTNAAAGIRSKSGDMSGAGKVAADSGTSGFNTGIVGMRDRAINAATNAASGLRSKSGDMRGAGTSFGGGATGGLTTEGNKWPGVTRGAANRAVNAVSRVSGFSGGSSVGASIGDGMAAGVNSKVSSVVASVQSMANSALAAAGNLLKIGSPSRVFIELGEDVGEGFAIGILNQENAVAAAAEQLAQAAIVDPPDIPVGEIDPQIAGLAGRGFTAGGQTIVNVQPGAVVVQVAPGTRPDEARQLGREAGRGFEEALAERQIRVTARSA